MGLLVAPDQAASARFSVRLRPLRLPRARDLSAEATRLLARSMRRSRSCRLIPSGNSNFS